MKIQFFIRLSLLIHIIIYFCSNSFAQDIVKQVKQNDKVVLKLIGHTGSIQWQKSSNNSSWTDLGGKTTTTLEVTVIEESYYRAKVVTGSCAPFYSEITLIKLTLNNENTVLDVEGNSYPIKSFGAQTWMVENLKTKKYSNGDLIGTINNIPVDGVHSSQWVYGDNESNEATYGRLYTWHTATDPRNVCPSGWRLPSKADWETLVKYLGDNNFNCDTEPRTVAKAMASTSLWSNSNGIHGSCAVGKNKETNNSSGFNGKPGGIRDSYENEYFDLKQRGFWWTSTTAHGNSSFYAELNKDLTVLRFLGSFRNTGISVRCIKDAEASNTHDVNVPIDQPNLEQCSQTSNANLSTLTTSQGTLSPAFTASTTAYTVSLPEGTTTVPNVTATSADANATVSITQATNLTGTAAERTATVMVTAEDGTTKKTYTVVFSVESATPDFSLNASTTSLSIPQGAFATTDISFTPSGGFNGAVALAIDAATPLPAGVTAQFTPASISSGSSTLRFDIAATSAPAGPITITVKGESGGNSKTIDISLTITEVTEPDFVLNATPQSVTIAQGRGADIQVSITELGGFSQEVALTANIAQAGLFASFSPDFVSGSGESLLTITADEDADLGAGELTITATSGTIVHTVSIALQVEPPPVVVIPANQFSPNGDGIDDTWQIKEIEKAPQMVITVFDRAGRVVFQKSSYQNDWDGTSEGRQLLPTTYYFVIRNEKGENVESGSVNLIR